MGLEIKGLNQAIKKLKAIDQALIEEVDAEVEAAAYEMNNVAVRVLSGPGPHGSNSDTGELLAKQQVIKASDRVYKVINAAKYAGYVEFGTGSKISIDPEWTEIASQWRGRGTGDFQEFLTRIEEWCTRRGYDPAYAYVICMHILEHGVPAKRFMQTAYKEVAPKLIERVQTIIKEAVNS